MISAGLILILSFVVMLYILTVPNWPIGRFLQIHMVPVSIIRITVSVNVAVSLVVAVISVTIIRGTPGAIQTQGQESTFQRLELTKDKLDEQRTSSIEFISDLRVEAVKKVIDDYISTANGILTLVVGLCSLVASMRVLDTRKGTAEMKDGDHQK